MKRLIVCCDGTWQKLTSAYPTNVAKLVQAIKPDPANLIFYGEGLGTGDLKDKITGGLFGWGIDQNIQEAYRFLCLNYQPGDQIYLFGFSRGAFTVRSLVGLVRAVGILPPWGIRKLPEAYKVYQNTKEDVAQTHSGDRQDIKLREEKDLVDFRNKLADEFGTAYRTADPNLGREEAAITFLGCWDTVGALGIPDQIPWLPLEEWVNRKYQFHNTRLSRRILHARHAVAIDEIRSEFNYTPMVSDATMPNQLKQVWFPGGHGAVGGGTKAASPLSNSALLWMFAEIKSLHLGLEFYDQNQANTIEDGLETDPTIYFQQETVLLSAPFKRVLPADAEFHPSVAQRWQACAWYRPDPLEEFAAHFGTAPDLRQAPLRSLNVGEQAEFVVMARETENRIPIQIQADGVYQIEVSPLQIWQDDDFLCTAKGWQATQAADSGDWEVQGIVEEDISVVVGRFYQLAKNASRVPEANWFELIVEVADQKVRIGLQNTFTAKGSGTLKAYANDAPVVYFNNKGWVFATITRTS